tara:strand:- start:323 stop:544 length:222 start_codon:yes stop_codon:yes gene_type:complete
VHLSKWKKTAQLNNIRGNKMRYQLTVWFKEQKFNDPEVPHTQITTFDVNLINDYLDKNWMNIAKHSIKCVGTG